MATTLRIKRRAAGGAAGAPAALKGAELAYNEQDNILYYGFGIASADDAASVIAIGGAGHVVTLGTTQTISGAKTWNGAQTFSGAAIVMTGATSLTVPTPGAADNTQKAANTAWVTLYYQPLDADLTALAGLAATAGMLSRTGAGAFAARTLTTGASTRIAITNADGAAGNPTIDLGTPTISGSGAAAGITKVTVDVYGRVTTTGQASISDLAVPSADVAWGSRKITGLLDPTAAQDAATKAYVDATAQGLDAKASCRAATTANITLSGAQTIDGVSVIAGDRVLVKDQSTTANNGIYLCAAGAWTRATDMDSWGEVPSTFCFIEEGTANGDTSWLCTSNAGGTLNTTAITFVQFGSATSYTAGAGMTLSGSTLAVGAGTGLTANADDIALTGQALALHNLGTSGIIARTGAGTVSARTITGSTGLTVTDGDGVAGNPTLTLNAGISPFSGLTWADDKVAIGSGAGAITLYDFSPVAQTLVEQTTQALMRTTGLGLGTMATQAASAVAITGGTIDGVVLDGGTF
jgi:hypothetical protein